MIKERVFTRTYEALDTWHLRRPALDAMWDAVMTDAALELVERVEAQLLREVQDAFYEETKDINSKSGAECLSVGAVERMTHYERKNYAV